ncbi:MAG: hypothetical protein QOF11_352 [Chloroflexota bacterium]|nr:hypothetical protein [Chloroflexota bacterium]
MSKMRAVEPEGHKRRIDEDDVEAHGAKLRAAGDDDVEGHGAKMRAFEPEGHKLRAAGDEDDTEGHGAKLRAAGDDDDTEGHMLGNPLLNQQLARAREQDIQRSLRASQARAEASRPHKK